MTDPLVIIPARLHSTRLPGKLLKRIGSRTLLEWTWLRAREARWQTVIATDSVEIEVAAKAFGATVIRTPECFNGTERCAAVLAELGDALPELVINWQGDSPCVPSAVARLLPLQMDHAAVATPVRRIATHELGQAVAVVRDSDFRALMFTRQPMPTGGPYWAHIGLYCYRSTALAAYRMTPASPFELAESLEQIRWIEGGQLVRCVPVEAGECPEVNEPADVERVERELGVSQ